ncbi:MFS transporter [Pseudomonas oryzihabitans]|uniref:MFS family arabinose efflux permease n=1 Tax=Pseudomonas oryzihabitans TaxID=47885 RepID=A0AAJ2BJD6_9PSED|nr:MFS transporter [Pseudomonas psychrotolerans]MDR6233870.1 putative MFS family arabinose efflux permease [Pseudomonas psychrotolerans]MDR6357051.1 putative MFS family arabinose efflux permease [Pseudomonas psychrotolerans]
MNDMPLSHSQTPPRTAILSPALLGLLATGAGLSVANLYYSQPLLGTLASDLPATAADVGLIPTLTQLGYAMGLLLLAPLGDRFDRRRIILAKLGILLLALLGASLAPGLHALLLASLVTGLAATVAQDLVPAAATLAPPAERGRIVGTVMTGLLLGILLSRVVSGLVGELFGWRTLYLVAAASIAAIGVAVWRGLPSFAATTQLSYPALLGSLGTLWRRHAALRRATLAQGLLSVGFSAFWSTLALYLHAGPFQLGSAAAGAFGLAGAAGALAAPWAGRLADRHGSEWVTRLGIGLAALAFASLLALPWLPGMAGLVLLAVATVVFDLGVQASLIAHQAQVYGLEPEARSRLNAVLFTGMFIGMASGAALGSLLLVRLGWSGVAGLALTAALLALLVRLWPAAARRT